MAIKIKVIIPVNTPAFNNVIREAVQPVLSPDVIVDVENIAAGSPHIESRYDSMINAPHVVEMAIKAQRDGFDGLFISDMDFCGVEAAREAVNIPVVCGFRASAYTAMMLAQRFSIITVLDSVADMQREHTRSFGIADNLASIRVVDMSVSSLNNRKMSIEKVFSESLKAIGEDGARAIILGCTGFVGVAQEVYRCLFDEGFDIPVLDPNCTAVSYLILLIRNRLSQSRLTYTSRQ